MPVLKGLFPMDEVVDGHGKAKILELLKILNRLQFLSILFLLLLHVITIKNKFKNLTDPRLKFLINR